MASKKIMIEKYIYAATSLYGVIRLRNLISVVNHYMEPAITIEYLEKIILEMANLKDKDIYYKDKVISALPTITDDDKYYRKVNRILEEQNGKPRYLPDPEEFLRYLNPYYYQPQKYFDNLKKFLIKKTSYCFKSSEQLDLDINYINILTRSTIDYTPFVSILDTMGYIIEEEDIYDIVNLEMDIRNNCRVYENNGYAPVEIRNIRDKSFFCR